MQKALTFCLLFFSLAASAQTSKHKLGIAAGGGPHYYKGDLGNGIKGDRDRVWRGAVVFQAGYYLNKSFDLSLIGSVGDLGYVPPLEAANKQISEDEQCPGCEDRVGVGNLNSRIAAAGIAVKYKFANGYLLPEKCIIKPYVFAGMAFNNVSDRMRMNCVKEGQYITYNAGAGVRYYLTKQVHLGYQLAAGYFNRDDMDYMAHGGNDMYVQSSLMLGIDIL